MHLLLSDKIVWLLFLGFILTIFYIRSHPHYATPWQQVFQQPIAMIAGVMIAVYAVIGLLDCIHFETALSLESVLDKLIGALNSHEETSYTAPFAVVFNADHPVSVSRVVMKGCLWGVISFLPIVVLFMYRPRRQRGFHSNRIAWKTGLLTTAVLWISAAILIALSAHYHIFGTNQIGQDMFYQTLKSVRTGLLIGTLTTLFMLPFALFFGLVAGYFGGVVDDAIQYLYTTLSSIPGVLLITAVILVLEVTITNHPALFSNYADRADVRLLALCAILGLTSWASLCRFLRAETLKLREQDFVIASITMGARKISIIISHILPNVMHIVIITIVLDFSGLVLAEAVLAYVGVGVDPTTPSWGNMINTSRLELARDPIVWWPLTAALSMMFFLVLSANVFADTVRDAFDPRS